MEVNRAKLIQILKLVESLQEQILIQPHSLFVNSVVEYLQHDILELAGISSSEEALTNGLSIYWTPEGRMYAEPQP